MGLENAWDAYCLDSAVHLFGSKVKNEMDSVNEKTDAGTRRKRDAILRRYVPELAKARQFRDPGK